jgi:hypothetical protein
MGEKRNAQRVRWEKSEQGPLRDPNVDGRMVLRQTVERWGGVVWTGLIWLRIGNSKGLS